MIFQFYMTIQNIKTYTSLIFMHQPFVVFEIVILFLRLFFFLLRLIFLHFLFAWLVDHPVVLIDLVFVLWNILLQFLCWRFLLSNIATSVQISLCLWKSNSESFFKWHSISWAGDQVLVEDWVDIAFLDRFCDTLWFLFQALCWSTVLVCCRYDLFNLLFH